MSIKRAQGRLPILLRCLQKGCRSAIGLLSFAASLASAELPTPEFGKEMVDRIVNPETRIAALREIVIAEEEARGKSDWAARSPATFFNYHEDIRLTRCPDPSGEKPLYLITFHSNYDALHRRHEPERHPMLYPTTQREREAVERLASESKPSDATKHSQFWQPPAEPIDQDRVLIFLNSEGQVVWPFGGNNMTDEDVIYDLNDDSILERVSLINYGVYDSRKGEHHMDTELLRISSVEMPSRTLLELVLNWHPHELNLSIRWDWAVRDIDSDGTYEIVIGPKADNGVEAEVVFRWDAETGQYTGPSGGREEHFLRLESTPKAWEQLMAIKNAGGMSYSPVATSSAETAFYERKPYTHQSLKALSPDELFNFMWGGKEKHPRPPPPPGTRPRPGEDRRREFEIPEDLTGLEPSAAALALAQANRTEQHRKDFELFMLDDLEPPQATWLTGTMESPIGIGTVYLGQTKARWWRTRFYGVPETTLYPFGHYEQNWRSSEIPRDEANWLSETMWWLTRIRSAPKTIEAIGLENETVRSDGFGPPPTKFGFRLLNAEGEALVDYPTDLPLRRCWQWVGPYDRQVCLSLAFPLWENFLGKFKTSGQKVDAIDAFDFFRSASKEEFPNDVPAAIFAQSVTSLGDIGDEEPLPALEQLMHHLPEPGALEQEWQAAKATWEELAKLEDQPDWKVWYERRQALDAATARLRGNLAWHLRERLPRAIRQIRLAQDEAALSELAAKPGSDSAIWALRQLEERQPEAALATLESVFLREESDWRTRILSYVARTDLAQAEELYLALPYPERAPLMVSFFRQVLDQEEFSKWIDPLIAAVESEEVPYNIRKACLSLLVPDHSPLRYPAPRIADRLKSLLDAELEKTITEETEPFLNELLRALVDRAQSGDLFEYAHELWARSVEKDVHSLALRALIQIAANGVTAEQSERLWKSLDPARSELQIEREDFVGYLFTADLRQARDTLSRLATRSPDEAEPLDNRSRYSLPKRGREHFARQLLAVWEEPHPATRAKCLLVFGMQVGKVRFTNSFPGPEGTAMEQLQQYFKQATPEERAEFVSFIKWLEKDDTVQAELEYNHSGSSFLYHGGKMTEETESQ